MKNNHIFLSLIATGLAGVFFLILSHVVFPAALRPDKLFAAAYSLAIVSFAVRDYARRPRIIRLKPATASLLRPVLPTVLDARQTRGLPVSRSLCAEHNVA